MAFTKPLILASISVFALAACDDPSNPDYQKTRNGAAIGAAAGVASQILAGNSADSALKAGALGAVVGAVIGNVLDKQEQDLRQDLEGSGATITNTGNELIVTLPEAITFATDSTSVRGSLQDESWVICKQLARIPRQHRGCDRPHRQRGR